MMSVIDTWSLDDNNRKFFLHFQLKFSIYGFIVAYVENGNISFFSVKF